MLKDSYKESFIDVLLTWLLNSIITQVVGVLMLLLVLVNRDQIRRWEHRLQK